MYAGRRHSVSDADVDKKYIFLGWLNGWLLVEPVDGRMDGWMDNRATAANVVDADDDTNRADRRW